MLRDFSGGRSARLATTHPPLGYPWSTCTASHTKEPPCAPSSMFPFRTKTRPRPWAPSGTGSRRSGTCPMASTPSLCRVAARRGSLRPQRALHLPGAGQARMLEVSRADDGRGLWHSVLGGRGLGQQGYAQRCARHGRRGPHRDRHRPRQRHSHRSRAGLRAGRDPRLPARALRLQARNVAHHQAVSLASTCTGCGALQGSHYLFEEPTSPFALTAINKLPALEFVRVEVAGVYGIPATKGDFDQALFTWHAATTPSSTRPCSRGFTCRAKLENRVQISSKIECENPRKSSMRK